MQKQNEEKDVRGKEKDNKKRVKAIVSFKDDDDDEGAATVRPW